MDNLTITFTHEEAEAVDAALEYMLNVGTPVPEIDPIWESSRKKIQEALKG